MQPMKLYGCAIILIQLRKMDHAHVMCAVEPKLHVFLHDVWLSISLLVHVFYKEM